MMFALWIAVTRLRPWGLVLEAGVQVLRVLAHDDEIDVGEAALDARQVADRPQVRVQVERLPEPDVDAGEALRDRRGDRSFERHPVAADRIQQFHRQ
jgi:hypothetical protein